jgi:hypothetical protein
MKSNHLKKSVKAGESTKNPGESTKVKGVKAPIPPIVQRKNRTNTPPKEENLTPHNTHKNTPSTRKITLYFLPSVLPVIVLITASIRTKKYSVLHPKVPRFSNTLPTSQEKEPS